MKTRRQLTLLVSVMIGGILLVSATGAIAISLIRSEIFRLSSETSPTQVKLAKLQRGFERISGAFARTSAATTSEELERVASDLNSTIAEVEAIAADLQKTAGAGGGGDRGEGQVIRRMADTGTQLREISRERLRARMQITDANRRIGAEIEGATKATRLFSDAIQEAQGKSQAVLVASKKTNLDANANIKALLTVRERVEQLRSIVQEARSVDKRFRLSPLQDKAKGVLDTVAATEMPDKAQSAQIKSFVDSFQVLAFAEPGGLLPARAAMLAAPEDAKAKAAYEDRHKSVIAAIDAVSSRIAEAIDPLQLSVRKANTGMNEATELISEVASAAAISGEVNARARALQAMAWQLLAVNDQASLERIVADVGQQADEANRSIAQLAALLPKIKQQSAASSLEAVKQSFSNIRTLLTGSGGVAVVVRAGLAKQQQAEQLSASSLASVREIVQSGSSRARNAEGAQEDAVNRIRNLAGATFWVLTLIAAGVLVAGMWVGRSVRLGILESEARQQRDAAEMRQMLDRLDSSQQKQKILERVGEGVAMLREASRELAGTSEIVSHNAEAVALGARNMEESINEISASANQASETGAGAARLVSEASGAVDSLGKASREIEQVTELIRSIAFQTNLLALNAAIQAAHAGDAGASFAVVAREIKDLAAKVSDSTVDIDRSVKSMGGGVGRVNDAMQKVSEIIVTIRGGQQTIAAAVEAQSDATGRIVAGIQQTVDGCKGDARSRGLHGMALQLGNLAEDLAKLCVAE